MNLPANSIGFLLVGSVHPRENARASLCMGINKGIASRGRGPFPLRRTVMRRSPRLLALVACVLLGVAGPAWAQTAPKEGDMAPDVRLKATQVKKVLPDAKEDTLSLTDLKGKKNVVLFYFPRALTKG